ncbi:predicted protein [Histoplasma capsulatum H143]|uniref:Uncharacterized protein n=1 Tax=Ajellomyces capsulatus (strain H143) TaxID=544712 RepID=C6HCC7_AJECH|nr:predicted protein [Histoplasma capsulatum H143]
MASLILFNKETAGSCTTYPANLRGNGCSADAAILAAQIIHSITPKRIFRKPKRCFVQCLESRGIILTSLFQKLGILDCDVLAIQEPWRNPFTMLAQLRTCMARLNGYLYRINISRMDQPAYGQARENCRAFPLLMSEVDDIPNRNAAIGFPTPSFWEKNHPQTIKTEFQI